MAAQPLLTARRRVALVGWSVMMVVIAALSLWPQGVVSDHHHLDKVAHFTAYAALAFLPAVFAASLRQAIGVLMVVGLISIGLEGGQALLPDRVPSLYDAAANLGGAFFGTCAGLVVRPILKQVLGEIRV